MERVKMKKMEPGKLRVKEAFLTRYLSGNDDDQQAVALAYVLSLRGDIEAARAKSDNAHKQEFDSWLWDVDQDDVLAVINQYGFGATEDAEEEKKD